METMVTGSGQAGNGGEPLIVNGDTATFVRDVLDASKKVPVVVDFWATWCGPCKTLGPTLERLVREARGAVRLVKIDVDRNQDLAAQMRIQSIPAVYAFRDGRPVDGFVGAQPESAIKAFLARLIGGGGPAAEIEHALAEAQALFEQGDVEGANEIFQEIHAHDPGNAPAVAGILRCLLKLGRKDEARQILTGLPDDLGKNAEIAAVRTALELADQAGEAPPADQLRSQVEQNPNDHQARYDLAMACYAAGDREGAVDELLELFRRNRSWNDEAARKQLVKLFEAFGPKDPLTLSARRRLSSLMFS